MLRPDPAYIYEGGVELAQPVPMDSGPGQRAPFPWIRDTAIARRDDGLYYMTVTSGTSMRCICGDRPI